MIGRLLNDHGLAKRVPGGQREGGGDRGGDVWPPLQGREEYRNVSCGSPRKKKTTFNLVKFCSREKQHYWSVGIF